MKLGVSTWSLLGLDVYSAVRAIGEAGAEYVELWGEAPHAYPALVDKRRLRDTISSFDMVVSAHAPFTDLNLASPFEPVRGAIERTLEDFVDFSAYLGAAMVTFHPGSVHNASLVPRGVESSTEALRRIVAKGEGRLAINVENMTKGASKYHYPLASTVESLHRILTEVPGLMCTIDTGHAHLNGLDPSAFAKEVGDKLREVHLCDNSGVSDDHLVPGEGTAPLGGFLSNVSGQDIFVCIEVNPYLYDAEAVARAIRTVRATMGRIR